MLNNEHMYQSTETKEASFFKASFVTIYNCKQRILLQHFSFVILSNLVMLALSVYNTISAVVSFLLFQD